MRTTEEVTVCDEHGIPDCSPLLNGCTALLKENAATGDEGPPKRMVVTHEFKCDHQVFDDVAAGIKTFELRKETRGEREFHVGDVLRLREHVRGAESGIHYGAAVDPGYRGYSGRYVDVEVTYILSAASTYDYGLLPGYACMSIDLLDKEVRW